MGRAAELVDPSAAGGHVVEGALVKAFHQLGCRAFEQRLDQPGDVVRGRVEDVGVEKHEDRRTAGGDTRVHRGTLAVLTLEVDDPRAVMVRHGRRVVARVVVDDDQLVDQVVVDEDGVEDVADGRRLVARGHDDGDAVRAL